MGDCEAGTLVSVESLLKYHSGHSGYLTSDRNPVQGQCMVGSLTGAVASQKVTEAPKGSLNLVGNQVSSVSAQGSLTVRLTGRAGTKVGTSDPAVACGSAVRPQRPVGSDCLLKTQVRAKSQDDVYGLTPARCWKVKRNG